MTRTEERAARNEVLFRQANEKISDKGEELEIAGELPFLCECEEPTCMQILRLTQEEYERARSSARQFVLAPGHETRDAQPIETTDRFTIVKKSGVSAEIAERADPRSTA
jgi:hypothetical protein